MSLIEVLIALLILFISLLGSASMQLNALKHTTSALESTRASFVAYSLLDRVRAESSGSGLSQVNHLAGQGRATES